jgi:heme-degrading monooxygenase HmoA
MIVTVFRSRLKPGAQEEYARWAGRIGELARRMPGHVSHKAFVADDGERVTIVEFESEESHLAWSAHAEHAAAKRKGRESFYSEYRIQVCTVQREAAFRAPSLPGATDP